MRRDAQPHREPASYALATAVELRIVAELFAQRVGILLAGEFVLPTLAAIGLWRTGYLWFGVWGVASIVLLVARLTLDEAFARRRERSSHTQRWRRFFLVGLLANGALCGIGAAGAVYSADAFTKMLVVGGLTAFVMGTAARSAIYPAAALGYLAVAETPLFVACMVTSDVYFRLYAMPIVFYGLAAYGVVRHLYEQAMRFMTADEEKAVLVLAVSRSNRDLEVANRQLATLASTDGLTGVLNRRSFDASLEREARSAQREDEHLSLLMLDIDLFKGYNDRYGHQAGDDCLRRVAQALCLGIRRPRDVLARYGGEEFTAILPNTDRSGAIALGEELRVAVEALGLKNAGAPTGVVTVSIGVATVSNARAWNTDELIGLADKALYEAKGWGRNCVRSAVAQLPVGTPPS